MGQQIYVTQTPEAGVTINNAAATTIFASKVIPYYGQKRIRVTALINVNKTDAANGQNVGLLMTVGAQTKTLTYQTKNTTNGSSGVIVFIFELPCQSDTTVKVEVPAGLTTDANCTFTGLYLSVETVDV